VLSCSVWKMGSPDYFFFGTNPFDVNIGQKSNCRVPRVFKQLALSFTR